MGLLLLAWRWGVSGMSNLIVGEHGGGGVGGPLSTGAGCVWSRPLLKPLKKEETTLSRLNITVTESH